MLTKKQYVKAVKALNKYIQRDLEIYNATDGMYDSVRFDELNDMIFAFESLLEELTGDDEDKYHTTDLSYFLYDVSGGANSTEEDGSSKVKDENGQSIYIRTEEELYDNMIQPRMTNADYLRGIDIESLATCMRTMVANNPDREDLIKCLKMPFKDK